MGTGWCQSRRVEARAVTARGAVCGARQTWPIQREYLVTCPPCFKIAKALSSEERSHPECRGTIQALSVTSSVRSPGKVVLIRLGVNFFLLETNFKNKTVKNNSRPPPPPPRYDIITPVAILHFVVTPPLILR